MAQFKIGARTVASNERPFTIAEAGINHNGDLDRAFKLVRIAKEAGADAVKFQTYKAEEIVGDNELTYAYKSQGQDVTESMLSMFKRCEFTVAQWHAIKEYCDRIDIMFLSTPSGESDLELLLELKVQALKISSDDLVHLPLIRKFAKTGLPIIASCGMSNLAEVYRALDTIGTFEGYPTALLVCTSRYPTPAAEANLMRIKTLSGAFPGLPIGFSDHTQGPLAAAIASALGACIFEKHFTDNHDAPGPDHWFSDDPTELTQWVTTIQEAKILMGDGIVRPSPAECSLLPELRRVIVASDDIKDGEALTDRNIALKKIRHKQALPASIFDLMLGTVAKKNYSKGQAIEI